MSEENYKGLTISLKGHYRMINNEKKGLISEFVKDLNKLDKNQSFYPINDLQELIKKWEEKLK